jgi:hypothetical protein
MMLDPGGHFVLIISRPSMPKIEANRRDAGTPDENKAILAGMLAFFGTYKVSIPDGLLTIHVEASTFPNWVRTAQKRYFTLAGDEMTWVNHAPAVSGETENWFGEARRPNKRGGWSVCWREPKGCEREQPR